MDIFKKCTLEEPTLKMKKSYLNYKKSFDNEGGDYFTSMFFGSLITEYKEILDWYNKNKYLNLNETCTKLNILKKENNILSPSCNNQPRKIYFLKRKIDSKIIGIIDIHCSYDCLLQQFNPEISYEIRPDERKKGYGKMLMNLFLKNNNIDADKFSIKIYASNIPSIKLIRNFSITELGTTVDYSEEEILHFQLDNPTKQIL